MISPHFRWRLLAFVSLLLAGCGGGARPADSPEAGQQPEQGAMYSTSSAPDGVRGEGSAREAEALLQTELEARGDEALPDSRLADVAAWAIETAYAQKDVSRATATDAGHRFGFAGMILGFMTGPLGEERGRAMLRDLVAQVPKNDPINRYGIVAGRGTDVVVFLARIEASLEDFPRTLEPGSSLRLKGEISKRFERSTLYLTNAEDEVRKVPMKGREIDASLEFRKAGVYELELLGDGATGPVVLVNVPLLVGSATREVATTSAAANPTLTAEEAETALLSLLEAARKKRDLPGPVADAQLRQVARAHSNDMAEHGFVSHISPTTGNPEDRVKKARIRVAGLAECIGEEITPEGVFQGLMNSPAHRASMLDAHHTHVGIGVAVAVTPQSRRRLLATFLFGRR